MYASGLNFLWLFACVVYCVNEFRVCVCDVFAYGCVIFVNVYRICDCVLWGCCACVYDSCMCYNACVRCWFEVCM